MMTKLFIPLAFLTIFQTTYSQDLEGYFQKYYIEGNLARLQESVDLGLDPNVAKINGLSIADYVISNSSNQIKVINVLDILLKSGLKLNNRNLFQKIVQNKSKKIIDFLIEKEISINSIVVDNQSSFSTDYLEYLIDKGFDINYKIIPSRKFEIKKANFINFLREGDLYAASVGLNTFMENQKMTHIELFYAIKTKDTLFINRILKQSDDNILITRSKGWDTKTYGEKPTFFNKNDYPLTWAMETNDLNVVKYLINKGAVPLEEGNTRSLPQIQKYVNYQYKIRWHKAFNSKYKKSRNTLENQLNFSSYDVPKNSLLKEIINKKFVRKVQRSFGLFSKYDKDFFIELKFLIKDKKIQDIYVKTNTVKDTRTLKAFLLAKDKNKEFFEKLFKAIKHNEICYSFKFPEKIE